MMPLQPGNGQPDKIIYIEKREQKVTKMDYEKETREMLETLSNNPDCGYIKNFIKREVLKSGKVVKVQLLIEID